VAIDCVDDIAVCGGKHYLNLFVAHFLWLVTNMARYTLRRW